MTPVAIITGASAGIGAELARVFARNGHRVALVARRGWALQALAAEIVAAGQPAPVVVAADLAQPDAAARIGEALAIQAFEPEYVVNNAGFGLIGRAAGLDRDRQLAMIDVNMRALSDLSLAFAASLKRRRGGILNVASVAGFMPGPSSAVYYASKAYVLAFSEAMHAELKPQGVRVTCLCPGPVLTEFQARAGIVEPEPAPFITLSAERVAAAGYRGPMRGKRLVVPGVANKLVAMLVPRLMPRVLLMSSLQARQDKRDRSLVPMT